MADTDIKYENIAVLTPTKKRFLKQYKAAKKNADTRHFYMDDYLNSLLDKELQK